MLQVTPEAMKWFAPHVLVTRSAAAEDERGGNAEDLQVALGAMESAAIEFPVVAKPACPACAN